MKSNINEKSFAEELVKILIQQLSSYYDRLDFLKEMKSKNEISTETLNYILDAVTNYSLKRTEGGKNEEKTRNA